MRDDASRRRADRIPDDRSVQSGWYEPGDRLVRARPSLCDHPLAYQRLLLPVTAYDVEQAARDIEDKSAAIGMVVEHWMSREIRTMSLSLSRHAGELSNVAYDPWLGMDRA